MLAIAILPKVLPDGRAEKEKQVVTLEQEKEKPQTERKITTPTVTKTPKRERCISGDCMNQRDETSRYCNIHNADRQPRHHKGGVYDDL